jgi:hypothetical protein
MARKLKEEIQDGAVAVAEAEQDPSQANGMRTSKVVKTHRGDEATIEAEGFDLAVLDTFKPYHDEDPLPRPVTAKNSKGTIFIKKPAEPRFYFEGTDFIKVQMGIHGKKISLFWRYNETKPVHKKIRAYLRRKGMPGA